MARSSLLVENDDASVNYCSEMTESLTCFRDSLLEGEKLEM